MKKALIQFTLVKSIDIYQVIASNDFSLNSSSDSEVSEIEDYELEVEGSPNSSDHADEETQEAYAYEPLADAYYSMKASVK